MKDYHPYLVGQGIASMSLTQLTRKYPKLASFTEAFENKMEPINGLKLPDFLIMPVQRIPRYIMLISQLLKFSLDKDGDEHQTLSAVGEKLKNLLLTINSDIDPEQAEMMDSVLAVIRMTPDLSEGDFPTNLSRKRLIDGELTLIKNNSKKEKDILSLLKKNRVYLFLFSDYLLFCKDTGKKSENDEKIYSYVAGGPVVLLSRAEFHTTKSKQFEITLEGEEWTFETKTDADSTRWVASLNGAMAKFTSNRGNDGVAIPRGLSQVMKKMLEKE